MSLFSKAKKYRKPSHSIDEKVKLLNKELHADFKADKNPVNPRNYFVPDFGVDHEI